MAKEKIKKIVEEKKSEWMGIAGFVLGSISFLTVLIAFLSIYSCYSPIGFFYLFFIGAAISFVFCILGIKKGSELGKAGLILNLIGFLLVVAFYFLAINGVISYCDTHSMSLCAGIRLKIQNSSDSSVTVHRTVGSSDASIVDLKILVNRNVAIILSPEDRSLMEGETKTYTVDYNIKSGDSIEVAPLIESRNSFERQYICEIIGETKAA